MITLNAEEKKGSDQKGLIFWSTFHKRTRNHCPQKNIVSQKNQKCNLISVLSHVSNSRVTRVVKSIVRVDAADSFLHPLDSASVFDLLYRPLVRFNGESRSAIFHRTAQYSGNKFSQVSCARKFIANYLYRAILIIDN